MRGREQQKKRKGERCKPATPGDEGAARAQMYAAREEQWQWESLKGANNERDKRATRVEWQGEEGKWSGGFIHLKPGWRLGGRAGQGQAATLARHGERLAAAARRV